MILYTTIHLGHYAKTKEDAFKLAISLISKGYTDLKVTKPPELVEQYDNYEYYSFSALATDEKQEATEFDFILQTVKLFQP